MIEIDEFHNSDFYKSSVLFEIDEYSNLEEGWDGYSAPPIAEEASKEARRLVTEHKIPTTGEVFPTGRGTIQFEYSDKEGKEVEFEVFGREKGEVLLISKDGSMDFKEASIEECVKTINNFLSDVM